ncbi:NapC/NirT family cytochrome c [Desulfococcaceae bacterium HSG8]|nr:NapC/NirT family cytochrome c [Desulfococcaceae bacterium HSG8]
MKKYYALFVCIGLLCLILVSKSFQSTSSTEFCMSCHEMKNYKNELEKSSHALDKDKKPIQCRQCHIPDSLGHKYLTVKAFLGTKDLIVHYMGNPDELDRRDMQKFARRFIPDENCLGCHQDLYKDAKEKKISEIGRLAHDAYLGKNGNTKRNCAGCHFNMAHLPEFDRRFPFNAEFAKRLPLKGVSKNDIVQPN